MGLRIEAPNVAADFTGHPLTTTVIPQDFPEGRDGVEVHFEAATSEGGAAGFRFVAGAGRAPGVHPPGCRDRDGLDRVARLDPRAGARVSADAAPGPPGSPETPWPPPGQHPPTSDEANARTRKNKGRRKRQTQRMRAQIRAADRLVATLEAIADIGAGLPPEIAAGIAEYRLAGEKGKKVPRRRAEMENLATEEPS